MSLADRLATLSPCTVAVVASLSASGAGCEPGVPGGKCELEIVVESDSGDVRPGVVYVMLDPTGDTTGDPELWAIDAGGHLPAGRTIWVDATGLRVLRAAGFECPSSGCDAVDPDVDTPGAVGHSSVSLEAGRSSRVVVDLEGVECGNSLVEQGEACDGAAGCSSDCSMPVSVLAEVPGSAGDGIAVLATGSGFTIAWIDDGCGTTAASCLSRVSFDAGGDRVSTVESIDIGETTGRLSTDRRRFLSWVASSGATGEAGRVLALAPEDEAGIVDLGANSSGSMAVSAVAASGDGAGDGPLALALEPETGTLELRWPGSGSTPAGAVPEDVYVRSPSLVVGPSGDGLSIAALWAIGTAVGPPTAWYLRHWTLACTSPSAGCIPSPKETDAMPIGLPVPDSPGFALLEGPPGQEQLLVSGTGGDLEARFFPFADMPPYDPSAVAKEPAADGWTPSGIDAREGIGVAVLLIAPAPTGTGCSSSMLLMPLDGGLPTHTASWDDRPPGCSGAIAILEDGRTVVAWRGPGPDPGTAAMGWTIVPIDNWR